MGLRMWSFLLAAWQSAVTRMLHREIKLLPFADATWGLMTTVTPASKDVNAVVTLPVPTITQLTVLNDRDIQLDFNSQPNILYRLQIAQNSATAFQNLQNVYETTTTTINNLSTDGNFYCFRLGAFDPATILPCIRIPSAVPTLMSRLSNNLNQLSWVTSSTGVSNYTFSKNSDPPLSAAAVCYFIERSKCYLWRELLLSTDHKLYQWKQKHFPFKMRYGYFDQRPHRCRKHFDNRRSRQ